MPDPKPIRKGAKTQKKQFDAQVDLFLDALQIVPDGTKKIDPEQAARPEGAPAVVTRLIDFIKKM